MNFQSETSGRLWYNKFYCILVPNNRNLHPVIYNKSTSASSLVGTVVTPETDTLANSNCSSSKSNW